MDITIDLIAQIGIAILGITAIVLVARKNKWGFVFGLLSQPFFFITAILHRQWGIVFLSTIYTGCWIYGIYEWFCRQKKKK